MTALVPIADSTLTEKIVSQFIAGLLSAHPLGPAEGFPVAG